MFERFVKLFTYLSLIGQLHGGSRVGVGVYFSYILCQDIRIDNNKIGPPSKSIIPLKKFTPLVIRVELGKNKY